MKKPEETKQTQNEDEMLDEYGHLPFKRAGNRFTKYGSAKTFVIDQEGQRQELTEYEKNLARVQTVH